LEEIELDIETGSFVAILGPSGCGKTTLLRTLGGLLEPTLGNVRLSGDLPAAARRRRAIGWLAQEDGLLPWRTVADNVRLPLRLAHAPRSGAELELLRRVGLDGNARQYPHELSGGMRQRVALARALVARPPFLLLDEPFAHLDELTRERLGDVLLELRTETEILPTTILVTHSVQEAVRLADRIVVLSPRPGRVTADMVVGLERPRHDDQPGFGSLVRELKDRLMAPFAGSSSRPSERLTEPFASARPTLEGQAHLDRSTPSAAITTR
jgi:NitT/TauT family transport system ATP-binding protein